ncbi:MAG: ATP-binding protein [Ardenticatenaceae bacterium]
MNWRDKLYSLRWRLMLSYVILIVVGFGSLALFSAIQIYNISKSDFRRDFENQASLLASTLHEPVEELDENKKSESEIKKASKILNNFSRPVDRDLILLHTDGQAWLDSTGNVPPADLSQKPEVSELIKSGKISSNFRNNEAGEWTLYVAAQVFDENKPIGLIHLSVSATGVQNEIYRGWLILAVGVGLMGLLALLSGLWLSSSLTRPLSQLRETALELASGDLSQRFPEPRNDEIGQLAQAFNHMADQVQSMISEQRAFASNASHELRTPLTTMALRLELLRDAQLDEATVDRYMEEMEGEIGRLNGLVEDLIWLSRFEANRVQRGDAQTDPIRFARAMLREQEKKAVAREIEMTLNTPSQLPPLVANQNHLQVVFRNLLDNAIKYTPNKGQVQWELHQQEGQLHAIVRDTGRGIAPEDLPHIGKRFFRSDKARSREVQGIGLGLSLVRLIVEFYGGELKIDSAGLEKGTTVEVWWPFEHQTTLSVAN